MKPASLVTIALVNTLLSAAMFGLCILALVSGTSPLLVVPLQISVVLILITPAMLVINLAAAAIATFARKSRTSAQIVAMIVAACGGLAYLGQGSPFGGDIGLAPVRFLFVIGLALPWAIGAGFFRFLRKA